VFRVRCAICHGAEGGGNGPAARFLNPKPTDLTQGPFKALGEGENFGEVLRRTLRSGVPGSSMPRFSALGDAELAQLVAFVKETAGRNGDEPEPPPPAGRILYEALGCPMCHGPGGAGDGPASATLMNDDGSHATAADLRYAKSFRLGRRSSDVARTILQGMPGTPMPAYGEVIDEAASRQLADYILDLLGLQ
jgi:cytochrome c oxidase cbb3-type subunit I/II